MPKRRGGFVRKREAQIQSMAKEKEAVCVTGANGFIGSWLVRTLLDPRLYQNPRLYIPRL
uniref:NAD-dependent epimerase/dehydratase domain-containing protein n=1 Tax=Salix viminalis TaxID=40686 RepID=A0A6N2K692_SALVM